MYKRQAQVRTLQLFSLKIAYCQSNHLIFSTNLGVLFLAESLLTTYLPTASENRPGGRVSRSHRAGLRHSACLSAPSFPRLEGGHGAILVPLILWLDFRLGDTPVDLHRRFLPHLVSNMGVGAVSYTHLDVYKRQVQARSVARSQARSRSGVATSSCQ